MKLLLRSLQVLKPNIRVNQWIILSSRNSQEIIIHIGITTKPFPSHYPRSVLLGCVDLVDVISHEEHMKIQGTLFICASIEYCFGC
jgi:hypothetical protein